MNVAPKIEAARPFGVEAAARLLAGKVPQAVLGLPEVPLFGLIGNRPASQVASDR